MAASIMSAAQSTREYLSLRDVNRQLAEENALLRELVVQLSSKQETLIEIGRAHV